MYIGFFNYYEVYNKNKMFTDKSSPIGDDLSYSSVYMGKYLVKNGHKINTIDMDNIANFDAIVFMEFPKFKNKYFKQFLWNSVIGAILTATSTYFLGCTFGAMGMVVGYFALTAFLGLGWATWIFFTKRGEWHSG